MMNEPQCANADIANCMSVMAFSSLALCAEKAAYGSRVLSAAIEPSAAPAGQVKIAQRRIKLYNDNPIPYAAHFASVQGARVHAFFRSVRHGQND
jgi:hypothetical protein